MKTAKSAKAAPASPARRRKLRLAVQNASRARNVPGEKDFERWARAALRDSARNHRLIITSRYELALDDLYDIEQIQLSGLPAADVDKKVVRLAAGPPSGEEAKARRERAVALADGNPRLLEWLFAVLAQPGLEQDALLDRLAERATLPVTPTSQA